MLHCQGERCTRVLHGGTGVFKVQVHTSPVPNFHALQGASQSKDSSASRHASFLNTSWNLKVETVSEWKVTPQGPPNPSKPLKALESGQDEQTQGLDFAVKLLNSKPLRIKSKFFFWYFLVFFFALKSSKSVSAPHLDFGTEDQVECRCQAHGALEKGSCEQQHHRPPTKPPFSCLLCS